MKRFGLVLIIFTCFSFNLLARDGSSGCGPGWYIFKENSILSSTLRVTTNAFLAPTTTIGMTFGTSNCSKHKLVQTEQESLKYATENYYELLYSVAKGEGEFLLQYADVIGCKRESFGTFKTKMRNKFQQVFPTYSPNPENVLRETYKVILQDTELVQSCSLS